MVRKTLGDKIAVQSLDEIVFARQYKQKKTSGWQSNEEMYYAKKIELQEARANVNLARMQEFVHTLLSKIDNPLVFKFTKRKEAQLKRVSLLNALREYDAKTDYWDLKDIVGKKQGIIYGRVIYAYYANSVDGKYEAHLDPVDVYDFLIDPAAGGIDIEVADYMGRYGIERNKKQLEDGMKKGTYHKANTRELLQSGGNADEITPETTNKESRSYDVTGNSKKEISNKSKYKFWEWVTTYEGERYYILMTTEGKWISCTLLKDKFESEMWPFWTWACFPDLTEFWTPSYCDFAREIFMAQDVSINQMLDNAEAINKPMKVVNVGMLENPAQLKYRRDGYIYTKGNFDANRVVQPLITPSINTPIDVFNILEQIQQKASGVTDGVTGVADEQGRVGIYEGNQAAVADRFGLLNKSYSFGYNRFAMLYENGVKEHLIKEQAVDILGPEGVEVKNVTRKDLFKKGDKYSVMVVASNADEVTSIQDKMAKINFLRTQGQNPTMNPKKAFEMEATIAGFTEEEIKQLQDTSEYGQAEIMAEAERDIEELLDGKDIDINDNANIAYKQRFVNYIKDHKEDINNKQFESLSTYLKTLEQTIMKNEASRLAREQTKMMQEQAQQPQLDTNSLNAPAEQQRELLQSGDLNNANIQTGQR